MRRLCSLLLAAALALCACLPADAETRNLSQIRSGNNNCTYDTVTTAWDFSLLKVDTDDTNALLIEQAGGTDVFYVDTTNQNVGIGPATNGYPLITGDAAASTTNPVYSVVGATTTGIGFTQATPSISGVVSGAEVWRTTATGVGIGGAPTQKLHVQGNVNSPVSAIIQNTNAGAGAYSNHRCLANAAEIGILCFSSGYTTSNQYTADSGLIESAATASAGLGLSAATGGIAIWTSSAKRWVIDHTNGHLVSGTAGGPSLRQAAPSSTVPTVCPSDTSGTTGLGLQASGKMSLIASATEVMRIDPSLIIALKSIAMPVNGYPSIAYEAASATNPIYALYSNSGTGIGGAYNATEANAYISTIINSVEHLRVDPDATATYTSMLVYDTDNAQMERVSVGAADSGGAGFKVLRIAN